MLPPGTHQIALTISAIVAIISDPGLLHHDLVWFALTIIMLDWVYLGVAWWKRTHVRAPAAASLAH